MKNQIIKKKSKAIFFDRDGTLNKDYGYVIKIKDFHWKKNAIKSIVNLYKKGFLIIIVTNQSGIGRKFYKIQDLNNLHNWVKKKVKVNGGRIHDIYFSPYYLLSKKYGTKKEFQRRKPNTGMIDEAKKKWNINLRLSYLIGDKDTDKKLANKLKIKFFKVKKNTDLMKIANKILY